MINATESKYTLGLAACYHMLKEYKNAINTYMLCGMLEPHNPIPYYHASDCYLKMNDKFSAVVALEMAADKASDDPRFQALKDRSLMSIESLNKELNKK